MTTTPTREDLFGPVEGDAALAAIEEHGFAVLADLATAEVIEHVFEQIRDVFAAAAASVPHPSAPPPSAINDLYRWLASNSPELKSHCYDLLGRLDAVHRLLVNDRVVALGHAFYDTPLVIDRTQIRIDDHSNERLLPLHQELGQIGMLNLTLWVPLVDINDQSGGMQIVPQSHREGRRRHRFFPERHNYHGLGESEYTDEDLVGVHLPRGWGLLFHPFLFHGSTPNRSHDIRWTAIARFNELRSIGYLRNPAAPLHMPQHLEEDDRHPA